MPSDNPNRFSVPTILDTDSSTRRIVLIRNRRLRTTAPPRFISAHSKRLDRPLCSWRKLPPPAHRTETGAALAEVRGNDSTPGTPLAPMSTSSARFGLGTFLFAGSKRAGRYGFRTGNCQIQRV